MMRNANVILWLCFIPAVLISIFGQDMAYFLNRHMADLPPVTYLNILTAVSFILIVSSCVILYTRYKRERTQKGTRYFMYPILGAVGVLTSCWSILVLVLWNG